MLKSIGVVCFNAFVIFPIILYLLAILSKFNVTHTFAINDLPDTWTIIWQMTFCIYMEDVGFSVAHRILHEPFLYKHIHKVHHTYT